MSGRGRLSTFSSGTMHLLTTLTAPPESTLAPASSAAGIMVPRRRPFGNLVTGLAFVALPLAVLVAPGAQAAPSPPTTVGARHAPAAHSEVRLWLPRPTGVAPVGVVSAYVADAFRPEPATGGVRTLPIRVWYPARHHPPMPPARYLSPVVESVVESALGVPSGLFAVDTYAATAAPPRHHSRGVLLLSGGYGIPAAFQTGQAVDLASHGWTVVAVDHPHDTYVVEQPGGGLIPNDRPEDAAFAERVRDVAVVLSHLPALVPSWRSGMPVGMFGHSMGGAAAAESMRLSTLLRAGVDLDGTPRGGVVKTGLDRPFGFLLSQRHTTASDQFLAELLSRLTAPHPVRQYRVEHYGFTDFVVFVPEAKAADPVLGARLAADFDTGVSTTTQGLADLASERAFLGSFFRRYMRFRG